ncbi:heparin cofactor 2-like isoform X1 [Hemiscyllium ocellatum]|uniref:heparin cofactor 2-like isoform X1 n=2 Tax=Hemiscyllium ocellatum TaxID=170820 RepID=UPI002965D783|nr:heparin cofactor 2-like isoform X1 [Hemiscyllium ocellatum]
MMFSSFRFLLCSLDFVSTAAAVASFDTGHIMPIESNTLTRELHVPDLDEYDYTELEDYGDDEDNYGFIEDMFVNKKPFAAPQSSESIRKKFRGKSRIQRLSLVNTNFAFNFYRALLRSQPASKNVVFSPFGLSSMMAMVMVGTSNRTQEQISQVLGFDHFVTSKPGVTGNEVLQDIFHKLIHRLFKHDFGYTLKDFSGIFVREGLKIRKPFREWLKNYYGAHTQSVDFSDPQALTKLNQLIVKTTKGKLQDVVGDIDPQTVMLIYQALHFKGSWEHKFIKSKTAMLQFHTGKATVVKVPMMYVRATMQATTDHTHECDVISLPYSANASMLLVVPYKTFGLRHIERELSWEMVDNWLKEMTNRTREVYIPKFTLHGNYDLIEMFEGLGVTDLFHNKADLSGICEHRNLYVNSLKQHVALKVDEEGSEVAAVSLSGFMPLSSQAKFMANRPFLFLILEHHTQSLLFMGRVMNPLNQ